MDLKDVKFHYSVNMMTLVFLILSLVSLLLSLAIFILFKSLRCTRNSVHTHMFISLALNNISWIIW